MTAPLHPVAGHEAARRALARARLRDGLPGALLLHGPPGVGKQRLGLWVAQLVLCERPSEAGPCGTCRQCHLALRLEHPDVHWHFPLPRPKGASTPEKLADALEDARFEALTERRESSLYPSWTGEARAHYLAAAQTLRRRAHRRPSMASTQLFLIGDAETLVPQESSPEAANALLKLLEEPPEGTRFILTSSEPGRLLATIRSRCLPLHLGRLSRDEVDAFLREYRPEAEDGEVRKAAALSHGAIGRAMGFLPSGKDPGPLEQVRLDALALLRAAAAGPGAGFRTALSFPPAGARALMELFAFLEEWLRDLAALAAGSPDAVTHRDHIRELERLVGSVDPAAVARSLEAVEEAREQARGNVNPQLVVAGLVSGLRRRLSAPAGIHAT